MSFQSVVHRHNNDIDSQGSVKETIHGRPAEKLNLKASILTICQLNTQKPSSVQKIHDTFRNFNAKGIAVEFCNQFTNDTVAEARFDTRIHTMMLFTTTA